MAHVFSRRPSNRCPKSIVPVVLAAMGDPSGSVTPGAVRAVWEALAGAAWIGSDPALATGDPQTGVAQHHVPSRLGPRWSLR